MSVTELDSLITKQQFKRCLLLERKAMTNLLCLITQPYPTLCNPMHCSPPGSSVHWDSPGKNTGVGCHTLLQGIFPTQGSNTHLLLGRWVLFHWGAGKGPAGLPVHSRLPLHLTLPPCTFLTLSSPAGRFPASFWDFFRTKWRLGLSAEEADLWAPFPAL